MTTYLAFQVLVGVGSMTALMGAVMIATSRDNLGVWGGAFNLVVGGALAVLCAFVLGLMS